VIVLLSHNGMDVDLKLAGRVRGIDAILGGHTHDGVPAPSVVRNAGGQTLAWQATTTGSWLGANPASGQLVPRMTTNVTVSVTSRARVFTSGRYESQMTFENLSTATNTESRVVELTIVDRPLLETLPSFSPGQFGLRLRSTPLIMFRIEASQDLSSWTAITTNATAANGTFEYSEPAPAHHRFFRASFVNP